jgi:high-affinity iron transporter
MLPTFVIGLREGLEAALIVGIIAAFLRRQGRVDLLRWVAVGVSIAIAMCVAVGVVLEVLSRDLPQRQQEGLETVVGGLAVAMVTYMVVWMRRHSRDLKATLEGAAAAALGDGGTAGRAMVVMAFLAVLREGFETVVFLIAAFNETGSGASPIVGACLGIAVAVVLGAGIYRGGVRLNLSKFFRATGLVLVLVAAGLVVTALHTAHEAGWLNTGQGATVDLTWLVRPDSVQASLLTGMLGVQAHPVVIEIAGWLAYLIPVGLYVGWPPGRAIPRRRVMTALAATVVAAGVATSAVVAAMPSGPRSRPVTAAGAVSAQVLSHQADHAVVRLTGLGVSPAAIRMTLAGSVSRDGLSVDRFAATSSEPAAASSGPPTLTASAIARLNGGRLPLGLAAGAAARVAVSYVAATAVQVLVEPTTFRVVNATATATVSAQAHAAVGTIPLDKPVSVHRTALPPAAVAASLAAANRDQQRIDQRSDRRTIAVVLATVAALALLSLGGYSVASRHRSSTSRVPATNLRGQQVGIN